MNRVRATTLEDVARAAGVSRATVSLALAGTGRLSAETRARVRAVAAELDYSVNVGASNLRRARAGALGVYLPESTNGLAYYMDFVFGAVETAAASGQSVTIVAGATAGERARAHVDGYILIDPPDDDPVVRRILEGRLPVVSGERVPSGLPAPWGVVYSDHRMGMTALMNHVAERGATRPALIAPPATTVWGSEVRDAYLAWCAAAGVEPIVRESPERFMPDDVRRVATELLSSADRPDAIISAPDGSAVGAVSAARGLGLEVGTDVLITAYADSLAMQMADPPITAIDLRARDFGRHCAAMLLSALHGDGDGAAGVTGTDAEARTDAEAAPEVEAEAFTIDLRVRASTGAPRPPQTRAP
ncbi:LacI family DNA-binding transcriptional regulator [Herbiconiux sp. A18JL235]|uniref:LacI family DNA-binding transcriptional regulator n=1 Tax=Herbiconiux sp. A18JL235 TaxID=3152363 RepID=A0AB39BH97_9MICO